MEVKQEAPGLLWRGFRFGMLLQLAVGPVCLYVLQTAMTAGFPAAESAVLGVVLADSLYIAAALLGLGALMDKSVRARAALRFFGAVVLVLFGLANILGAFGIVILPAVPLKSGPSGGAFLYALVLTLSNPLTIVFWAGVFASRMGESNMKARGAALFGLGAVCSTLAFLSAAAAAGSALSGLLRGAALPVLNAVVGVILIFFGMHTALGRKAERERRAAP